MQKKYSVNPEKKKNLIKNMRHKQKSSTMIWNIFQMIGWVILAAVLLISLIILVPAVLEPLCLGYYSEAFLSLLTFVPVVTIALMLYLIISSLKTYMEKKYLIPWVAFSEENIWFFDNLIEWGHCNRLKGEYYWMLIMDYKDIQRIEYDEEQHLLRIYGPYRGRKWSDFKQSYCINSFTNNKDEGLEDHFVICDYYDDFGELKRDLEMVSGMTIIVKNNPKKF